MTLDNKMHNLEFLANLKKDEKCKIVSNSLMVDTDNFYEVNSTNIELLIVNSLIMSLHNEYKTLQEKDDNLNKVDVCISNIYENKYLNKLLSNSKHFNDSMCLIESIYDNIRTRVQKNKCNRIYYIFNENFTIFLNNTIKVCKAIHKTNMYIHGLDNTSSDDDDDLIDIDDDNVEKEVDDADDDSDSLKKD